MTGKDRLKAELMIFAIKNDFFGYGSMISLQANGRYKAIVDGESYTFSLKQLVDEFNNLDEFQVRDILDYYYQKELCKDN